MRTRFSMNFLGAYTQSQRENLASWWFAIIVAAMCVIFGSTWVGFLHVFLPTLQTLSQTVNIELSWAVRFLIAIYTWLLPLFFYCTAVTTIVKESLIRDLRKKRTWNTAIFVGVVLVVGLAELALYLQTAHMAKVTSH